MGSKEKRDLLMMSETQVERPLSKGNQVLALLMLESNKSEEVTPLHPLVNHSFLNTMMYSHKSYLQESLQSEALSKVTYRCNLQETKEIQCQVEELMGNCYMCESMSPCSLLTLLVPKKHGFFHVCG